MSVTTEQRFADALEKMAGAMEKIAEAVNTQAQTNTTLANGVRRMTATIQGAQSAAADNLKKGLEAGERSRQSLAEIDRQIKNGELNVPRDQNP